MSSNNKIRIGLVGCGRISSKHFEAIYDNRDRLELTAICDVNEQALEKSNIDVPRYVSFEDMLSHEELDIVSLCTPSGLHPSQAIFAAKHGLHVITEKPMATRWADGLAMIKAF